MRPHGKYVRINPSEESKLRMVVYLAKNIVNGNCYVGSTKHRFSSRKNGHFKAAVKNHLRGCPIFYKAIRKYGKDSFEWFILDNASSVKELRELETIWISKLKPKYNIATVGWGGNGGKFSKDGLRSISEFQKGKQWRLGMTHSEETRQCLSDWALKNPEHWKKYRILGPIALSKRVVCLDTGKFYESASAAARLHKISKSMVIEVCLRNKRRKTVGGLTFRYFGDHHGGKKEAEMMIAERHNGRSSYGRSCAKPLICDTYGTKFSGSLAASNEYCISRGSINEICRGKKKSIYGLKFSYLKCA